MNRGKARHRVIGDVFDAKGKPAANVASAMRDGHGEGSLKDGRARLRLGTFAGGGAMKGGDGWARASQSRRWLSAEPPCWSCPAAMAPSSPLLLRLPVTVSPGSAALSTLGETARFTAEVRDQNGQAMAGAAVAWSSSDASVATVDASGQVTAVCLHRHNKRHARQGAALDSVGFHTAATPLLRRERTNVRYSMGHRLERRVANRNVLPDR